MQRPLDNQHVIDIKPLPSPRTIKTKLPIPDQAAALVERYRPLLEFQPASFGRGRDEVIGDLGGPPLSNTLVVSPGVSLRRNQSLRDDLSRLVGQAALDAADHQVIASWATLAVPPARGLVALREHCLLDRAHALVAGLRPARLELLERLLGEVHAIFQLLLCGVPGFVDLRLGILGLVVGLENALHIHRADLHGLGGRGGGTDGVEQLPERMPFGVPGAGRTLVLVTHDPALAERAGRTIRLAGGAIVR